MNYSKVKVNEQTQMANIKYIDLPEGAVLNFKEIIEGTFEQNGKEVANDSIKCVVKADGNKRDGGIIKLPVREFLKMTADGDLFKSEDGNENVKFPKAITIKSKADRTTQDGETSYPLYAYNKAAEYMEEGSDLEWEDVVKGGLKENNGGFSPVQNYTVTVQHS